jgi:hypothetical protein
MVDYDGNLCMRRHSRSLCASDEDIGCLCWLARNENGGKGQNGCVQSVYIYVSFAPDHLIVDQIE